jgi:trans-aconitate 2-methyltransferase
MTENQWDAALYEKLYEDRNSVVWQYGAEVIELLSPQPGENILDLGCGTGQITWKIAESGAEVMGIDNAPTMIEQARKNYPSLRFEVANGVNFNFGNSFDAVFSNATLHWIKEPEQVILHIWSALKPGGRFVAEFGGKGNLQAIIAAMFSAMEAINYPAKPEMNPWYFPTIGEYTTLLEKQGFCVTYATLFERTTPLEGSEAGVRNWIKLIGNNFLLSIPYAQHSDFMQHVEQYLRLKFYRNGSWFADYRTLRVVAQKD